MNIADDEIIKKLIAKNHFVNFGGERSKFICEIKRIEDHPDKEITENVYQNAYSKYFNNKYHQIILTSDAFIKKETNPYSNSIFASTKIKKMRFHKTEVDKTEKYNNRDGKGFVISKLYNLLQRGSVFYFKDNNGIESFLENENLKKIGYNKFYKIINTK
jgi:hypothetical protein